MRKNNYVFGAIFLALTAGLIVLAAYLSTDAPKSVSISQKGELAASETNFDFGTISMVKGKVTHIFKVKNIGSETVNLSRLYTSCMCTTVLLKTGSNQDGPFGMQGHGFVPYISRDLLPGEEAEIVTTFDPAAHGPAGVGKISRTVSLENNTKAGILALNFSAIVTP